MRAQVKFRIVTLPAVLFAGMAFGPGSAFGTALPIVGDGGILTISDAAGVPFGITSAPVFCINWGGDPTCAGATHTMTVSGASVLFSFPTTGTVQDVSTTVPAIDFVDVTGGATVGGATIHFDLTSIPTNGPVNVGNCSSNAPMNTCTPASSPFTYLEDITGRQVTISFATLMNAYTGTSASGVTPYMARYSTNLSGTINGAGACSGVVVNITNILSCEAAGGTLVATWSATAAPATAPSVITIITTSFANGAVGTLYSQNLTAIGGASPYSWSIIAGRLPLGLSLNSATGQISGIPVYASTSTVTFGVTDSSLPRQTATVTLSFPII
jgi:hypothetical protein